MILNSENHEIETLLNDLDGSGSDKEWKSVNKLRSLLGNQLPIYLLQQFRSAKKWARRSSLVYHAIRYAKQSEEAIELGFLAIKDKSKIVRYRGCMLLACSQRKDVLPKLRCMLTSVSSDSEADLLAALDAIESQNQNYFVDRDHSGQIVLNIL